MIQYFRVLEKSGLSMKDQLPNGRISLGEALMAPTVIYVKQVNPNALFYLQETILEYFP